MKKCREVQRNSEKFREMQKMQKIHLTFQILGQLFGAYRRPMDAIFKTEGLK